MDSKIEGNLIKEKEHKILDFLYYWNRPIRAGDLSQELGIKHSTLNSILKRLEEEGIVKWEKYGPVSLTEKGLELAAHLSNHHFIVEKFLKESLDISDELAHKEAIHLAGAFSCELISAICKKLGISHDKIQTEFCSPRTYTTNYKDLRPSQKTEKEEEKIEVKNK